MKCDCGCGREAKEGNKIIHGHNNRGKRWKLKRDKKCICKYCNGEFLGKNSRNIICPDCRSKKNKHFCKCKCGTMIPMWSEYASGHNIIVANPAKQLGCRKKISKGQKKYYKTKEGIKERRDISKRMKEDNPMKNPGTAKEVGIKLSKYYQSIEGKKALKRRGRKISKTVNSEGWKEKYGKGRSEKLSKAMLENWKNPDSKHNSDEYIEKKRESMKKLWKDPNSKLNSDETREKQRKARLTQVLPFKDTSIEVKIQEFLNKLGIAYIPHQPITKIKHFYQCDMYIPFSNLVIECDGDYWHSYPVGREIDHVRNKEMKEKGYKVLRLWERDINRMDIEEFSGILDGVMNRSQK